MRFENITPNEEPVEIVQKDGTVKQYVLREANGEAAAKYRSAQAATYKFRDQQLSGLNHGVGEVEPMLISMCLFELYGTPAKERPVTLSFVKSLPPRVTGPLFDKIKEMTPNLDGTAKETEDVLLKRQVETERKLAVLRGEQEDDAKNLPTAIINGSA